MEVYYSSYTTRLVFIFQIFSHDSTKFHQNGEEQCGQRVPEGLNIMGLISQPHDQMTRLLLPQLVTYALEDEWYGNYPYIRVILSQTTHVCTTAKELWYSHFIHMLIWYSGTSWTRNLWDLIVKVGILVHQIWKMDQVPQVSLQGSPWWMLQNGFATCPRVKHCYFLENLNNHPPGLK